MHRVHSIHTRTICVWDWFGLLWFTPSPTMISVIEYFSTYSVLHSARPAGVKSAYEKHCKQSVIISLCFKYNVKYSRENVFTNKIHKYRIDARIHFEYEDDCVLRVSIGWRYYSNYYTYFQTRLRYIIMINILRLNFNFLKTSLPWPIGATRNRNKITCIRIIDEETR